MIFRNHTFTGKEKYFSHIDQEIDNITKTREIDSIYDFELLHFLNKGLDGFPE